MRKMLEAIVKAPEERIKKKPNEIIKSISFYEGDEVICKCVRAKHA
jgi:hypothetical protein